ncbi:hypothetical protein DEU56DRAFT_760656 [Suillus clintonianus]|uniref:uncharacterized protein n=1 Tax=Suillus clintonianus TaxID=1904413 RepID=UPI001B88016D|nr:uncharacterized protein DEU56DRAFT_760656 [Suillus clintonianus]KAG2121479.1 hypothetical protein DEU56DRAFT_760656 [Suillus clintonianus]
MKKSPKDVRNALANGGRIVHDHVSGKGTAEREEKDNRNAGSHKEVKTLDSLAISSSHEPPSDISEVSSEELESVYTSTKLTKTLAARGEAVDVVAGESTATTKLMFRATTEGPGHEISRNLLSWMIQRFRTLVGVPLDEPLNGQLIQQSPDEYEDLTEHDYLEALGIERLYAALLNAHESPGHLIHLAHALGRAANETNMLSDSKPDTPALEPLPPTMLPLPGTVTSGDDLANTKDIFPYVIEYRRVDNVGATSHRYKPFSSIGWKETDDEDDDDDEYMPYNLDL